MTAAARLFRTAFDREPEGVWSAPGRVNLIGEHTDYNGGLVLPFALSKRTDVAMALRHGGTSRICSSFAPGHVIELGPDDLNPGRTTGWVAYVAGVLWAMQADDGWDIAIDSSVPVGSGLSSSAALTCAVATGIDELLGLRLGRRELARRAQAAENGYVGVPTGGMDQVASMLCTRGHALLFDTREDTTEAIPFDPRSAGIDTVVVDTGVRHSHAEGSYADRRAECEQAAEELDVPTLRDIDTLDLNVALARLGSDRLRRRVRHVVTENDRVRSAVDALCTGDWERVGRLLAEAHVSVRDDFEVSCPELDLTVETLLSNGALGARLTGGGFGGSVVCLVPSSRSPKAVAAIEEAFLSRALPAPTAFPVVPSGGAARIDDEEAMNASG